MLFIQSEHDIFCKKQWASRCAKLIDVYSKRVAITATTKGGATKQCISEAEHNFTQHFLEFSV